MAGSENVFGTSLHQALSQAFAHHRAGRLAQAESCCRSALRLDPRQADAWNLLGVIAGSTGRMAEAVDAFSRAAAARPAEVEYHGNLAEALLAVSRINEAIAEYQRIIALASNHPEAYKRVGFILYSQGRAEESVRALIEADRLGGGDPSLMNQLALSLRKLGRHDEATNWSQKALAAASRSQDASAHYERGIALEGLGRLEEAANAHQQAIRLNPSLWPAGLGAVLHKLGRTDEALACYERALSMNLNYPLMHMSRGLLLLVKGRYEEGWREYAWRWQCPTQHAQALPSFPQPLWRGQDAGGKTVFLYPEQGLGDAILAVRYAPLVRQVKGAAKVVLLSDPALARLFRQSMPEVQVIVPGDPLPAFDLHAPLLDLPLVFGTTLQTIPAEPYLRADPRQAADWRQRIEYVARGRLKIGLAWAGNSANRADRQRSVTLEMLAPLSHAIGADRVAWFSLQKGPAAEQSSHLPAAMELHDFTADLHDFGDTAALMDALDLVVAVDTSVVHLAGAMGKPTWVLLPAAWWWLWLEQREDSPWYPSVRLFRQSRRGEWSEAIRRVAEALATFGLS